MSVYNRKMFKPRNARNALNQSAGVAPVQKFHAGGAVGHSHRPTGPRNVTPSGQIVRPTGIQTFASRSGRQYFSPGTASNPYTAGLIDIARRAKEGGIGSLSVAERAQLQAVAGGQSALNATQGVEDYLGDTLASDVVRGGASLLGTGQGMLSSLALSPFMSDSGDTSTVGGRLGSIEPTDEFLATLGINPVPKNYDDAILRQQRASQVPVVPKPPASRPTSLGPGRFRQLALPGSSSAGIPDGELAARQRDIDRAQKITAAGGTVDVDEVTGEIRARNPAGEIQELINAARLGPDGQYDGDDLGTARTGPAVPDSELLVGSRYDDGTAEGAFPETETETETETTTTTETETTTSPTGSTAEERTDTDPAADIKVPQPKPENFPEIVAQAKAANAAQGVPEQDSASSEIQTAVEKGTGSAEDLKAEFLKLLPKYEADPSVMGLNVALMGFTIASGKSANALENFSEGMKKTIPNFIKDAQAKKAFERETDLLASKYVIQRKEGDRTRGFSKNSYYAAEDFTAPDGREIVKGTHLRLNDNAFEAMGGAPLVDGATYRQIINDANDLAKAKITASGSKKGLDDYYMTKTVKKDLNQNVSVEIVYPTREGLALGLKPQLAGGDREWTAATAGYVQDLEAMAFTDNALEDAIKLAEKGALGTPGLLGKLADSARGATEGTVMEGVLKSAGLEYGVVSAASEFENLNRIIALQSARIILNEGGKMISNQEREQVARSLGFADATYDNTTDTMNLGSWKNTFTNKEQAIDALRRVQTIIRNRAEEASKNYARIGSEVGYEIGGLKEAKATAPGARLQQGDDGIWDMVPSGGS